MRKKKDILRVFEKISFILSFLPSEGDGVEVPGHVGPVGQGRLPAPSISTHMTELLDSVDGIEGKIVPKIFFISPCRDF